MSSLLFLKFLNILLGGLNIDDYSRRYFFLSNRRKKRTIKAVERFLNMGTLTKTNNILKSVKATLDDKELEDYVNTQLIYPSIENHLVSIR